jgi:hypothetical protein
MTRRQYVTEPFVAGRLQGFLKSLAEAFLSCIEHSIFSPDAGPFYPLRGLSASRRSRSIIINMRLSKKIARNFPSCSSRLVAFGNLVL